MKKTLSLILCLMLMLSAMPKCIRAEENAVHGLTYEVKAGFVTITGYTDEVAEYCVIPDTIEDLPVTGIAEDAFVEAPVKTLVIPSGMTEIAEGAFYKSEITLFSTFNNDTFECGLDLYNKVTDTLLHVGAIPRFPTYGHQAKNIGYRACAGMQVDQYISFANAERIGEEAFADASVTSIHLSSAADIEENAFLNCLFDKIYFGGIGDVSKNAFKGCKCDAYFYCDAPQFEDDAFEGSEINVFYEKGTLGWDEFSFDGITEKTEFEPDVYKLDFNWCTLDNTNSYTYYATLEVKEALAVRKADIPEPPEVEGYFPTEYYYCRTPVYKDYSDMLIVYYPTGSLHFTFVDGLTGEVFLEDDVELFTYYEMPEAPVHETYRFTGYGKKTVNGEEYDVYSIGEQVYEKYDLIITADYEPIMFTVDYYDLLQSEENKHLTSEQVHMSEDATFPVEAPEHAGYKFVGWDKDGKNITDNTQIYAVYEKINYEVGDINGDGEINTGDAVIVLKHLAELMQLSGDELVRADMNADGEVNTADAVKILRKAAGLE